MKISGLFAALSIIAASACTAERALSPQPSAPASAISVVPGMSQVPLLFVVDGVRFPKDQVPVLGAEQVASVTVLKGTRALEQYGPDASYGVVIIKTKLGSAPRS